jgi:hypothetical protein
MGLLMPQKPCPTVTILRQTEAATNTPEVDVTQQLLSELPGGNSLPDIPLPDVPLPLAAPNSLVSNE